MITFRCESCETPMNARPDEVGSQQRCPMCNTVVVVPSESDPNAKPIQLKVTKIGNATYQVVCPKCKGTHNFRESSLGSTTKCRNCGFKIKLPDTIRTSGSGCLGVLLLLGAGVAAVVKIL